ncbi:MAG: DUF3566 domain-containing protein [Actinocrinis sp.]
MSESSNPLDGRPSGSRSYGDAPTAVRPAAPVSTAHSAAPGAPMATAPGAGPLPPVPDAADSRRSFGLGGTGVGGGNNSGSGGGSPADSVGRALSGASRSFARVGAAIGNATQDSRQARPGRKPKPAVSGNPGAARVRKARLRVARVDPWSVMKVSFVLSIAMGIVTIVGTAVVWNVLNAIGVFDSLNKTVGDLTSSGNTNGTSSSFNLATFLSFGHVEGYMMIIALVDVVLATALATLGAYLYNLAAGFVGGFEVTLAEDQ